MNDRHALDDVDRGLIHALSIDGRAPFSRIGAALGVSTQTVARRYRRLVADAALRVVGLADAGHAGRPRWMIRLTAGPPTAQDVAQALARRPDTSWVKLTSGGTEIFAIIDPPPGAEGDHSLLLQDIPRTAGITAVSAHNLLHTYFGGPTGWRGRPTVLTEAQQALLAPTAEAQPARGVLTPDDRALMAALRRDGRTSLADLATATGWSPATVARRLADLRAAGAIFYDVEIAPELFGATMQALLWMSVAPAQLDEVGTTLAGHDELAFVAATTGPTNLVANALCSGPAALHRYLTRRLGPLEAIRSIETAPVLRTVKAVGPVARSRDPSAPPGRQRT
jgi:DNA-binding Lrp family transcriptional regulator